MRISLIASSILVLALSCNENRNNERNEQQTSQGSGSDRPNVDSSIHNDQVDDTNIVKSIEFGNVIIPGETAQEYVKNYKRKYLRTLSGRPIARTEAVWFSKGFIEYIYKQIHSGTGTAENIDGVRIYLGAYTTRQPSNTMPRTHHNDQISLFWVATKDSVREGLGHKDDTSFFKLPIQIKSKAAVANHGQLCPSNCKGKTLAL